MPLSMRRRIDTSTSGNASVPANPIRSRPAWGDKAELWNQPRFGQVAQRIGLVMVEIQWSLIEESLFEYDRDHAIVAGNVLSQAAITVDQHERDRIECQ